MQKRNKNNTFAKPMKTKSDYIIIEREKGIYSILARTYVLWIIPMWSELTYIENKKEYVYLFDSVYEAEDFIEQIIQ